MPSAVPRPVVAGLVAVTAILLTGASVQPAAASVSSSYEHAAQKQTNVERSDRDLRKLKKSSCLDRFAEKQARAMAEQQRMFHQDLGPILQTCHLSQVGENVAYGYPNGKAVVAAWMASPGHRHNILTARYRTTGVGAYQDVDGRWYVSQVLGRHV